MVVGVRMEVGGVITTKPRTGFVPDTMHTQTRFSTLKFSTFVRENKIGWGRSVKGFIF